ncbi:MAG TPA: carboxypeptidase-like regulatory domain-containing protein [Pyrinomonadaceae bacterium]|nr:carboxypeptidase-like regulatory domain-containing protein [Pyrinomonadaceae bacterium]
MVSSGRYAISSILVVLSTVIIAQAQAAPDKTSGATITGKVTIKGEGAPGIAVVLVQNVEGSQRITRHRAFTDATGTYQITNVPPGNYRATTATPKFVAVAELPNPFDKSKTLLINKDETVESIDFELMRGGVITGRVTDSDGRPVIEETVSISSAESNRSSGYSIGWHRDTRTDDRGVYRIFGIAPGNYKVAAGTNELSPSWEKSGFRQTFHQDVTDASQATPINVTEGSEMTNVDITIKEVGRTYSVRGRIIDSETGQPLANVPYGISVYLTPNSRSGLSDGSVSNSNGEFQWHNLRPGKYSVYVNAQSDGDRSFEEAPFEVSDRDVMGIVVKRIKVTTVSGVIILDGTDDKSVLAKLREARVSARIENDKTTTSTSTGILPDGSFRFSGLFAGVATFRVEARGLELVRVERNGVVHPAGITIRDREQISGLRLIVHYGDASIRGVLKLPDNAPLPANARFSVLLKRIGEPVAQFDQPGSYRSAEVDARGQFVAADLLPGTYEVMAHSYPPDKAQGQILSGKQQVTVTGGVVTNITVTLQPLSSSNPPWPRN